MNHATELQLNDYLDGALTPMEAGALEVHLHSCASCRAELDALRALVAQVHTLPRGIRPERDLLADIRGTIDRERIVELPTTRRRVLWSMRGQLAAAAILLIMTTAIFTRRSDFRTDMASSPSPNTVLVSAELRSLEEKYLSAITELQTLLSAQQSGLSPQTQRLLQENLRMIDQAIRESRAAIEQDPGNEMVNDMLRDAYEKKLEVLRRAAAVTST